jgi:uncharacterized damage-inducible protein DinB
MTTMTMTAERADLLESLAKHRYFLTFTARDLTDEQAGRRSTPSALTVGGLIKHVTATERQWARFIVEGAAAMTADVDESGAPSAQAMADWAGQFAMEQGDSLTDLLTAYQQVAATTDQLVRTLPDLDAAHPLPPAPWFEPGARWSARRVILHIIAETAQHAGHADIVREAIDGQRSMG